MLMSLNSYMTPIAPCVNRKGKGAVMALAAVFSLIKCLHGKIIFIFYFPRILGKWLWMTTLAGKFLPQMKLVLKNHRPHRLYKYYGAAPVFLGPHHEARTRQNYQEIKKEDYFS